MPTHRDKDNGTLKILYKYTREVHTYTLITLSAKDTNFKAFYHNILYLPLRFAKFFSDNIYLHMYYIRLKIARALHHINDAIDVF